jgi:hypothetical protein
MTLGPPGVDLMNPFRPLVTGKALIEVEVYKLDFYVWSFGYHLKIKDYTYVMSDK